MEWLAHRFPEVVFPDGVATSALDAELALAVEVLVPAKLLALNPKP